MLEGNLNVKKNVNKKATYFLGKTTALKLLYVQNYFILIQVLFQQLQRKEENPIKK